MQHQQPQASPLVQVGETENNGESADHKNDHLAILEDKNVGWEFSKVKRLLHLLRFHLQEFLRVFVVNSLELDWNWTATC